MMGLKECEGISKVCYNIRSYGVYCLDNSPTFYILSILDSSILVQATIWLFVIIAN